MPATTDHTRKDVLSERERYALAIATASESELLDLCYDLGDDPFDVAASVRHLLRTTPDKTPMSLPAFSLFLLAAAAAFVMVLVSPHHAGAGADVFATVRNTEPHFVCSAGSPLQIPDSITETQLKGLCQIEAPARN
jgi:hypothetical protein